MSGSLTIIGDRQVGKTTMVVKLHDPGTQHVQVISDLSRYYNPQTQEIAGTMSKQEAPLLVNVDLPAGERQIQVRWIDTPGEAWDNPQWRVVNPSAWQDIKTEVGESQGVLLLLPPHRNMVQSNDAIPLPRPNAWAENLDRWLQFFSGSCRNVEHILISIHKADLFCDTHSFAQEWRYDPLRSAKWYEYDRYVRKMYFSKFESAIRRYNAQNRNTKLRFFITSKDEPDLLEMPWVYLGSFLSGR